MNEYLNGGIHLGFWIVQNRLERFKRRGLEQHSRHFGIESDPVQHFDDAVVGQRRVGGVMVQQEAISVDDLVVSESVEKSCG